MSSTTTTTTTLKPNSGAAVPDVAAAGDDHQTQAEWLSANGVADPSARIAMTRLSHVRYQHPDLEEISTFLADFGAVVAKRQGDEVWYKGYGPDQYVYYARRGPKMFLGGAFEVGSMDELKRASELPGAGAIEEIKDAPGGGFMLTVVDPEGFPFNLVCGQEPVEVDPAASAEGGSLPGKLPFNYEVEKERVRKFQRFQTGPAAIHKLGHFGYTVVNFPEMVSFYTKNFNLVPSDCMYVKTAPAEEVKEGSGSGDGGGSGGGEDRRVATIFFHLDLGDTLVDHHCLFIGGGGASAHVHHASFEVHDFDTQALGHRWLARKGYRSVWGVGRHVLGSQIFDYWRDTSGNMVEHYADGDLVNRRSPVAFVEAGSDSLAIWGPEVPADFLG